jgi:hypothetical protein
MDQGQMLHATVNELTKDLLEGGTAIVQRGSAEEPGFIGFVADTGCLTIVSVTEAPNEKDGTRVSRIDLDAAGVRALAHFLESFGLEKVLPKGENLSTGELS